MCTCQLYTPVTTASLMGRSVIQTRARLQVPGIPTSPTSVLLPLVTLPQDMHIMRYDPECPQRQMTFDTLLDESSVGWVTRWRDRKTLGSNTLCRKQTYVSHLSIRTQPWYSTGLAQGLASPGDCVFLGTLALSGHKVGCLHCLKTSFLFCTLQALP